MKVLSEDLEIHKTLKFKDMEKGRLLNMIRDWESSIPNMKVLT